MTTVSSSSPVFSSDSKTVAMSSSRASRLSIRLR